MICEQIGGPAPIAPRKKGVWKAVCFETGAQARGAKKWHAELIIMQSQDLRTAFTPRNHSSLNHTTSIAAPGDELFSKVLCERGSNPREQIL